MIHLVFIYCAFLVLTIAYHRFRLIFPGLSVTILIIFNAFIFTKRDETIYSWFNFCAKARGSIMFFGCQKRDSLD